jgi:signal transduction histidine kinase
MTRAAELPVPNQPQEVVDLATTLNAMLARLHRSVDATRRFAADASHELRTPLTALGYDLETLRAHPELAIADRATMLEAMTVEHARLVALLDGLLTLARGDAEALPARSFVDVGALLRAAVGAAASRHPESSITLTIPEHEDPVVVDGWPEGLRAAVDNLIENAARHGRTGGRIAVGIARVASDRAVVTIADDGDGIPEDQRSALLERFARGAGRRTTGSGLGLAIAKQQAELHGGHLELATSTHGGLLASISIRTVADPDHPDDAYDG